MSPCQRAFVFAAAMSVGAVSQDAHAQPAPQGPVQPDALDEGAPGAIPPQQADALFDKALELMKEQRFGEACPLLTRANQLDPTSGTAFNLARCLEVIGKTATAARHFEEAASLAEVEGRPERVEAAQQALESLKGRLSLLVIEVPSPLPGLELTRDGKPVPESTWGEQIAVDPDRYVIEAEAPGYETYRQELEVPIGPTTERVRVELTPLPPPSPEPSATATADDQGFELGGFHYAGIGLGGLGVVSLAVGGILGGLAIAKNGDSEQLCRPEDPTRCTTEGKELRDEAFRLATGSTAMMVVGGVTLGAGAALFFIVPLLDDDDGDDLEVGLAPGSLTLRGRW